VLEVSKELIENFVRGDSINSDEYIAHYSDENKVIGELIHLDTGSVVSTENCDRLTVYRPDLLDIDTELEGRVNEFNLANPVVSEQHPVSKL